MGWVVLGIGALVVMLLAKSSGDTAVPTTPKTVPIYNPAMPPSDLESWIASKVPSQIADWAPSLSEGAQATCPSDFGDIKSWALLLCAIMARESDGGYAAPYSPKGAADGWGDGGNAFGLFQLDKHYHAAFINSDKAADPTAQAIYAGGILKQNWHHYHDKFLTVATYNASRTRIDEMVASGASYDEIDNTTTNHYATDVIARAERWA